MPLIKVQGLRHTYRRGDHETPALRGVDLTVDEGEWVAIIGSNGSGKSTLARHFNGLVLPQEGRVTVAGIELDRAHPERVWEVRRQVGMVFQNPDNQLVAPTVEEDIAFGPENLGVPPAEIGQRIERSLAAVRMSDFRQQEPHRLSGGQKQRVAIAGALALEARCLVLDEATSMLDPRGRRELMDAVRQLNRERGITMVQITHFMEEAAAADRVIALHQGQVALQGPPREVFARGDELAHIGLGVPAATQLASWWMADELLPPSSHLPITLAELVDALCALN